MKKYTLEEIEAWRKMRKMGYSLGQIAMESGADTNTIRYNTDEAYRLKTREKNSKRYDPHADRKAKYTSPPAAFLRVETAAPEPVIVEFFHHMPAWPKPRWLAEFEARHK